MKNSSMHLNETMQNLAEERKKKKERMNLFAFAVAADIADEDEDDYQMNWNWQENYYCWRKRILILSDLILF